MPADYGDESGEKMLDNFARFAERMGVEAMRNRSTQIKRAFDNARDFAGEKQAPWNELTEWAKLDMREFKQIEGYDEIKQVIESKLKAKGVESAWFNDEKVGKEHLLFRIADAKEVWQGFDELSKETERASELVCQASEKGLDAMFGKSFQMKQALDNAQNLTNSKDAKTGRDERPLEERAAQARKASEALEESKGKAPARTRDDKLQELRSR